jgi:hypothetical protein
MNFLKFIVFFIFVLFPLNAFSLTIAPGTVKLETEPGVPKTFAMKIYNESSVKIIVTPSVMEFTMNKNGKKIVKPIGSLPSSVAKYLTFPSGDFLLDPKETKEFNMTINVPKSVIGGNYALAFFRATRYIPPGSKFKTKVATAIKLGATILQETKGTEIISSKIKSVTITKPNKESPLSFSMNLINEGNTYIQASATVAVLGKDDTFIGTFNIKDKLILAGKEGIIKGELKMPHEPGLYHALITYQYRDKSITINKPFSIE